MTPGAAKCRRRSRAGACPAWPSTSNAARVSHLPTSGHRRLVVAPLEFVAWGDKVARGSERLQILDEVRLVRWRQMQVEQCVVVIDHGAEIGRAAVVKVRRMLPQCA